MQNKVINLTDRRNAAMFSRIYCLEKPCDDGSIISIRLSGDETFSTSCPKCGGDVSLSFDKFFDLMKDGDIFSTTVCCRDCSAEYVKNNAPTTDK